MRFHPVSGSSLSSGFSAKKIEEVAVHACQLLVHCEGLH